MEKFSPLDSNKLTNNYRADYLESLILPTEKLMLYLKVEHVPVVENNSHT